MNTLSLLKKTESHLKPTAILLTLLTLLLILFVIPAAAESFTVSETVVLRASEEDFPSNEALAEDYLTRAFYGGGSTVRLRKATAASRLSGIDLTCYNKLKPLITEVANGEESNTVFSFPLDQIFPKLSFTYSELELIVQPLVLSYQ